MTTKTRSTHQPLPRSVVFTSLPGPTRKRLPSPYCYRLTFETAEPNESGCLLQWDVMGGRDIYQVALERAEDGRLRWHCTCADAVYRGETRASACKHVRGLQGQHRAAG
jgi:hypothetical protein